MSKIIHDSPRTHSDQGSWSTPGADKFPEQKFKDGDIVQLKSGGPNMTIERFSQRIVPNPYKNVYTCIWFDPSGNVQRLSFDEHLLIKSI